MNIKIKPSDLAIIHTYYSADMLKRHTQSLESRKKVFGLLTGTLGVIASFIMWTILIVAFFK